MKKTIRVELGKLILAFGLFALFTRFPSTWLMVLLSVGIMASDFQAALLPKRPIRPKAIYRLARRAGRKRSNR